MNPRSRDSGPPSRSDVPIPTCECGSLVFPVRGKEAGRLERTKRAAPDEIKKHRTTTQVSVQMLNMEELHRDCLCSPLSDRPPSPAIRELEATNRMGKREKREAHSPIVPAMERSWICLAVSRRWLCMASIMLMLPSPPCPPFATTSISLPASSFSWLTTPASGSFDIPAAARVAILR